MKILRLFITIILCFIALFLLDQNATAQTIDATHKTLTHTFLDGLEWGFVSVLQPCLYAMFPVTVSFFLKRSNTRAHGIKNATLYSISIVTIFTLLGLLVTIVFGTATLYQVSTSAIF